MCSRNYQKRGERWCTLSKKIAHYIWAKSKEKRWFLNYFDLQKSLYFIGLLLHPSDLGGLFERCHCALLEKETHTNKVIYKATILQIRPYLQKTIQDHIRSYKALYGPTSPHTVIQYNNVSHKITICPQRIFMSKWKYLLALEQISIANTFCSSWNIFWT